MPEVEESLENYIKKIKINIKVFESKPCAIQYTKEYENILQTAARTCLVRLDDHKFQLNLIKITQKERNHKKLTKREI